MGVKRKYKRGERKRERETSSDKLEAISAFFICKQNTQESWQHCGAVSVKPFSNCGSEELRSSTVKMF